MLDLGLRILELIMMLVYELQLFVHSIPRKWWFLAQITLAVDHKYIGRFLHLPHWMSGAHNCGSWKLKLNDRGVRGAGSMIEGWNIERCTIRYSSHKLLSEMTKMPIALAFTLVSFSEIISLEESIDFAGFPLCFFHLHCNSMIVFKLLNQSLHNKAQRSRVGF